MDSIKVGMKDTILLGKKYQLTSYDVYYLNLCLHHDLPIATLDKKLENGFSPSGCTIFNP